MRKVIVNGIYKHFKGNSYKVLLIGKDSETLEEKVVYQSVLEPEKIWIRSLKEFLSEVDHLKYPDIKQKYRFEIQNKTKK